MNRVPRVFLLLLLILFLLVHCIIVSLDKDYFPIFTHFYPLVAKVWFELGRFILIMDLPLRLENLFLALKMVFLLGIALALFAFKYDGFYKISLWLASIFFACYLLLMFLLGIASLYPIYTIMLGVILIVFLSRLKTATAQL